MRPSYPESVAVLKERVEIIGDALSEVTRNPCHDDEVLGPSIFRMLLEDFSLEGLTLLGLYVGRSELRRVSFRDSDLSLSTFNWSDFEQCSFEGADLSRADLRACNFMRCRFDMAILNSADLRGSSFEHCTFERAQFLGTQLFRRSRMFGFVKVGDDQEALPLSTEQRRAASWSGDTPEPGGG